MATFPYRCPIDGPFDLRLPIGTATPSAACPRCGSDASRVFTAPMIATGDPTRRALIERCDETRYAPAVVDAPPAAGRRSPTGAPAAHGPSRNPAWSRLPRP